MTDEAETKRAPRIYVEPPVPISTEFKTKPQIEIVINQHVSGRFRMSALLTERMLRNPRLRGVMNTRLAGFISSKVEFEAVRENRDARRAAREFAEDWPAMMPAPIRRQYKKWSILMGLSFAQRALTLSPSSGRQIFRVRPYWPGFANWYWSEGGYRIQTYDAGVVDAQSPGLSDVAAPSPTLTGLINPSEQPWMIDEPNGENSWREAMIMAAYDPWFGHNGASRDQNRNSEKNGIGAIKFKYPRGEGDQHQAAIDRYVLAARTMGTEGTYPLEQRGKAEGNFDVEPFEFNGTGNGAISDALNANAVALAILFLGHNLTTEIKGGGSYAAAGVGEYIRDDIKDEDGEGEKAVVIPQLARPYCLLNYNDPDLAPRMRHITDSVATNKAMATMYQALGQAVQFLRMNAPRFDVDAFCDQWRIPLLPVGSVQIPATPMPAAPTVTPPAKTADDDDDDESEGDDE